MIEVALAALIWVVTIGVALYAISVVVDIIASATESVKAVYQEQQRRIAEKKCAELSAELEKLKGEKTK